MILNKYNIQEHLDSLPNSCNYITSEITHACWINAEDNGLLKEGTIEEDYDYEIVCIMRKKEKIEGEI